MSDTGKCDSCSKSFQYDLLHNGFNESTYAYCNECGMLAILSAWKVPTGIKLNAQQMIEPEIESYLAPCQCGGQFKAGASPRCPHCHIPLSTDKATKWIEANAPGTAKGWKWQRSWTGIYPISIEKHYVHECWKVGL